MFDASVQAKEDFVRKEREKVESVAKLRSNHLISIQEYAAVKAGERPDAAQYEKIKQEQIEKVMEEKKQAEEAHRRYEEEQKRAAEEVRAARGAK